jgi:H+/Cl- antiporter ClcA
MAKIMMRRREFTTVGLASGVAAGFNSPIGGLLFAMEDLASFWTKSLTWLAFTCCVISVIVANLFNSAYTGFRQTATFGLLADFVSFRSIACQGQLTQIIVRLLQGSGLCVK